MRFPKCSQEYMGNIAKPCLIQVELATKAQSFVKPKHLNKHLKVLVFDLRPINYSKTMTEVAKTLEFEVGICKLLRGHDQNNCFEPRLARVWL